VRVIIRDRDGYTYISRGLSIVDEGWYKYYPYLKPREAYIPRLMGGERVSVLNVSLKTLWSKPSHSISKIDLLRWMEGVNIGTEATRSRIIEVLFKRGYLKNGRDVEVTDLGFTVSSIIEELFPQLSTPKLTRYFEERLDEIRSGRTSRKEVVEEAIKTIDMLLDDYKRKLNAIGLRLATALGLKEPRVKCMICGREAVNCSGYKFCQYHCMAYNRIRDKLPVLREVLGEDYGKLLERISRMKTSGRWVREVASHLLRSGGQPL